MISLWLDTKRYPLFGSIFSAPETEKPVVVFWRIVGINSEHPDHIVVIKYVKAVGDSKRALDEYDSEIFCGGQNIISC
ncbi:MAG: hypothetical protein II339_03355, partial [Spirochaetales bacterium]|nr:hypothetical protein [Spirochaetales bacterium]